MTLKELMPWSLFDLTILGAELRLWVALLAGALAAWIAAWILALLLKQAAGRLAARTETDLDDRVIAATLAPARLLIAVLLFGAMLVPLQAPEPAGTALLFLVKVLALIALVILVLRLVDLFTEVVRSRLESLRRTDYLSLLPMTRTFTKVVVFLLAVLFLLQNMGLDVTGLIAGLGIGGLALALAAQKTLENIFGGLSLIADRPVRVGDVCKFGDHIGTVEEIGLRSTRIRTPERTVVTVPNADFSSMILENLAHRDRIRIFITLGVRYETSPDQLRWLLVEIRKLLLAHPMIHPDPARVRFVNFGDFSLDLEVFAYVRTRDWNEFLAVREDVFLRIMDLVAESGTDFAFPSTTTYLGRDTGLNEERTRQAEKAVRALREEGSLPLPDVPAETARKINDTLDYPPRGSASAK